VALSLRGTGAAELEERLRRAPTPVVARVVEDRVVVDLRAVADDELVVLRRMLTTVLADTGDRGRGAG
jgi:seryl-tRNA(Sec) selenium transferase